MNQVVSDYKLPDTFPNLNNITVDGSDQAEQDRYVKQFLEALRMKNLSQRVENNLINVQS